ncbi:zeta toxin family protein [Sphingosinicellaceae bacterium]|nr:zeta toxin family protein [Sphingosinicellaceae bacterium]
MSKTPRKPERPVLWIIAGPNGSGKSSLYNRSDIEGWGGSVWIINPDLLTSHIVEQEQLDLTAANLAAVQRIEHWLNGSLDVYQTIGVETVLSSPKYRELVLRAQSKGFETRMLFVLLKTVAMQIERVRIRVRGGGHDVPEDKIRSRRTRSFEQLAWFAEHVDRLAVFDNSAREPELMATKALGRTIVWHHRPPGPLRAEFVAAGIENLPPVRASAKSRG